VERVDAVEAQVQPGHVARGDRERAFGRQLRHLRRHAELVAHDVVAELAQRHRHVALRRRRQRGVDELERLDAPLVGVHELRRARCRVAASERRRQLVRPAREQLGRARHVRRALLRGALRLLAHAHARHAPAVGRHRAIGARQVRAVLEERAQPDRRRLLRREVVRELLRRKTLRIGLLRLFPQPLRQAQHGEVPQRRVALQIGVLDGEEVAHARERHVGELGARAPQRVRGRFDLAIGGGARQLGRSRRALFGLLGVAVPAAERAQHLEARQLDHRAHRRVAGQPRGAHAIERLLVTVEERLALDRAEERARVRVIVAGVLQRRVVLLQRGVVLAGLEELVGFAEHGRLLGLGSRLMARQEHDREQSEEQGEPLHESTSHKDELQTRERGSTI
jgi:hypothetical protein